jgi:hypothetical protein
MDGIEDDKAAWPLRGWALAALGAALGLAIHGLVDQADHWRITDSPLRLAAATFLGVAGIAFALTVERVRIGWSAGFAAAAGLVVASVIYWNGGPGDWQANDGWRLFCGALAVGIAAPLFQVIRDNGRRALPYAAVHDHAWTNAMLGGLALAFLGIVWLLAWLLSSLFGLIGVDVLKHLLEKAWFGWMLSGAALGAGIALLRDQGRIVRQFQRVVIVVLSVLAPVLGAGLAIFLVATLFTGLKPLWEATRDTTPILLSCVAGAFILANDVIGDGPEDEARNPLLRWAGVALAAVILPLAVIAAISTGLRLDQYGLTPSRLWALTFIAVACAVGLAYWVALARKRLRWAEAARPANLHLAIGLCVLMLLLSTPLVSFGALSARSQVARLEAGKIAPERFDWAALRYDFGPAGRKAVERLAQSPRPAIRTAAANALAAKDRWALAEAARVPDAKAVFMNRVQIVPVPVALPDALMDAVIASFDPCSQGNGKDSCFIRYFADAGEAVVVSRPPNCRGCVFEARYYAREPDGRWAKADSRRAPDRPDEAALVDQRIGAALGEIEVREVKRRQVFVGDKPVGEPFE